MILALRVSLFCYLGWYVSGQSFGNSSSSSVPSALPSSRVIVNVSTLVPLNFPSVTPSSFNDTLSSFVPTIVSNSIPTTAIPIIVSDLPTIGFNSSQQFNTSFPTVSPVATVNPTAEPSTFTPSVLPTAAPSAVPSTLPSLSPTVVPSYQPTVSQAPTVPRLCHVDHLEWISNGLCDFSGGYNTFACGYDGGDCCQSTRKPGNSTTANDTTYGSLLFDCKDPTILRNASIAFVLGNMTMSERPATADELINLLTQTWIDALALVNASSIITVTFNQSLYNAILVDAHISYELYLADTSDIVRNLSSIALNDTLLQFVQSGDLQQILRVMASQLGLIEFIWSSVCDTIQACVTPSKVEKNPGITCSFTEENWRNFYGWAENVWTGQSFPKYFVWLLLQFFLVLWFTLCLGMCYYQERYFLSRSRRLQYCLSLATGILIILYLLLEIFVPGLYAEPRTFACIEFSFTDEAKGLVYADATSADYYFWNPYICTVMMLVMSLVCLSGFYQLPRMRMDLLADTALGRVLRVLGSATQLDSVAIKLFLLGILILLVVHAAMPNVGVFSAMSLPKLVQVYQLHCGCQQLLVVLQAQVLEAVDELQCRIARQNKSNDPVLHTPPLSSDETSSINNGASSNECSEASHSNEDAKEETERPVEPTPLAELPFRNTVSSGAAALAKSLLGVLWIVTAVIDMRDTPLLALILYSVTQRVCLLVVMLLLSYSSADTPLPK